MYPFQMLLAALRGSAHVPALGSVVFPLLLHRTLRRRWVLPLARPPAGVRDVAGPDNVKSAGDSHRRRVMQRRTNNIRSGAAERGTLPGGETLGGGGGENRERFHRFHTPPKNGSVLPPPTPTVLHYTRTTVCLGKERIRFR